MLQNALDFTLFSPNALDSLLHSPSVKGLDATLSTQTLAQLYVSMPVVPVAFLEQELYLGELFLLVVLERLEIFIVVFGGSFLQLQNFPDFHFAFKFRLHFLLSRKALSATVSEALVLLSSSLPLAIRLTH